MSCVTGNSHVLSSFLFDFFSFDFFDLQVGRPYIVCELLRGAVQDNIAVKRLSEGERNFANSARVRIIRFRLGLIRMIRVRLTLGLG